MGERNHLGPEGDLESQDPPRVMCQSPGPCLCHSSASGLFVSSRGEGFPGPAWHLLPALERLQGKLRPHQDFIKEE